MNIRQSIFNKNNKLKQEKSKVHIISQLLGESITLTDKQINFLSSKKRYVFGNLGRRDGKTFIQLVDMAYNISNNKKCVYIANSINSINSIKPLASKIFNRFNIDFDTNSENIKFLTIDLFRKKIIGNSYDEIYIDEYSQYYHSFFGCVFPIVSLNTSCNIKGLCTPINDIPLDIWIDSNKLNMEMI